MERTQTFKVAISYAEPAAAIHAKEMAERLAAELEFECDAWSFESLNMPWLRDQAAMIASTANMIIIAADSHQELPESVTNWIRGWLPKRRSEPGVLVVLFEDELMNTSKPPPSCAFLHWIAGQAGMDFLCNLTGDRDLAPSMPGATKAEYFEASG